MNTRVCASEGLLHIAHESCAELLYDFLHAQRLWVRQAADSLPYHNMLRMRGGAKACTMQVQARRVSGEQLTSLMQGLR